jgi:hypothetical protein
VKIIGYADDCTIYLAHANMAVIRMKLQDTVYNLGKWSEQSGFRFSQTKTVTIHFCRLRPRRHLHLDPKISLKGHDIKLVDSHKILGLIFDKRLDWLAHINYVKAIASKRVNILKCVSNVRWGADQDFIRCQFCLHLNTDLLHIHQLDSETSKN